jgi:hypothetical protein
MRRYSMEFNRVVRDNIQRAIMIFRRAGLSVTKLPHKTSLMVERPTWMSWQQFKRIVRSVLQPQRGSVILFSETSGRTFVCQNRGNRPGLFVAY